MAADPPALNTDVLIVGAGPIGLASAIELAWRGVACVMIDQGDGAVDLSRGGMVAARTMEYCRRWGIADRVATAGFPQDWPLGMVYCTALGGHILEREPYPAQGARPPLAQSPQDRTWCPQLFFDPMLARAVGEHSNVRMLYRHRLDDFVQDEAAVRAEVTDLAAGRRLTLAARYMIGCDGAASAVRAALGLGQDGNPNLGYSVNIYFAAPGLERATGAGAAERYLLVGPGGVWGNITVVDGRGNWRLTVLAGQDKVDLDGFDAPGHVRRAIGRDEVAFEVTAVRPWRRSEQICRSYRAGRVFLAGDAAHTMSPTGGFGMNTGVIDAVNLGWKLDAVLAGWGGSGLLDTYSAEQRQVAIRNARASTHNFNVMTGLKAMAGPVLDAGAKGDATRAEVGRHLRAGLREEWECLGVQLGYRYEASPVVIDDASPAPPDEIATYVPSARPGSRAPHAWLPDGRSTLDLFGRGFVLMRLGRDAPARPDLVAAARKHGVPLREVAIASDDIAALYDAPYVLVRPDGHVCWRSRSAPRDAGLVLDTVRGASAGTDIEAAGERKE